MIDELSLTRTRDDGQVTTSSIKVRNINMGIRLHLAKYCIVVPYRYTIYTLINASNIDYE